MNLIRNLRTVFVLASTFLFLSSYEKSLKIVGKPLSAAYDFAGIVAKTLQLNGPDSANTQPQRKQSGYRHYRPLEPHQELVQAKRRTKC